MPPAKDNENALKHGHGRRNRTTPEYRVWRNARNRCTNPLNDHWNGMEPRVSGSFLSVVGVKPHPKARLCRIDREDDYRPGNVAWL